VLQTPFGDTADQPILYDALGFLAARMLDFDVDGLVILGLASEASALTEGERDAVCETVGIHASRTSIVAGIDGTTAVAVDRARRAVRHGAKGLMVLPPRGATVDQLVTHFCRVADAGGVPILIQDSPQVTGVELAPEVFARLAAAHPLLCAAKVEGPGAGPKVSRLVEAGIEVVAGWGGLHYPESLRRGAIGCMPGSDLGPAITRMDRLWRDGSKDASEDLYRKILPLLSYVAQSLPLLILGAKRVLHRAGIFPTAAMRTPAPELDRQQAETLDALFDRLHADQVPGW
jgi:4-hydroxy-tetrahydrodipicolinate synthase